MTPIRWQGSLELADLTWPGVRDSVGPHAVLAVPLGATEQHGPHLPHSVDTDIAVALCAGLAEARPEVVVAPPLPFGASGAPSRVSPSKNVSSGG